MKRKFKVKFSVELVGELELEADGRSDAVGIVRFDTPLADLMEIVDLSDQGGENISVTDIQEVK